MRPGRLDLGGGHSSGMHSSRTHRPDSHTPCSNLAGCRRGTCTPSTDPVERKGRRRTCCTRPCRRTFGSRCTRHSSRGSLSWARGTAAAEAWEAPATVAGWA
eukprot:356704-Chlamydomonas_euryale.AAC.12